MDFRKLHKQNKPLLIGNVWDVRSAKTFEKLNFQAIGTSSAAMASIFGYQDGIQLTFNELESFVRHIMLNTNLPLTVDMESGYSSNPIEIAHNIRKLSELGVAGINIEDSFVSESRVLQNVESFADHIKIIKNELSKDSIDVFINVRTDTFLLGIPNLLEETINRVKHFTDAGADGIFVPCIQSENDIAAVVSSTYLPLNVMSIPGLPDFDTLTELGVKRISTGNFLFEKMHTELEGIVNSILKERSFNSIF